MFGRHTLALTVAGALLLSAGPQNTSQAAAVGADGGITLWISYDNSDLANGLDIDSVVNTINASCDATNGARANFGEPDSPSSCPGAAANCSGRDKLSGDVQQLATYIFASTEGANYLRRVYVADGGRSWDTADVRWDMMEAGSTANPGGWKNINSHINLRRSARRCIHDVLHHEFGHYFHNLPDRYERAASAGYYRGRIGGGSAFNVGVTEADENTVMSLNFPHLFVDDTNARTEIEYTPPGGSAVSGEVLTPDLLTDGDPSNDGPNRAHHGFTEKFAKDEWSSMPNEHVHLAGVHTSGDFSGPDMSSMPDVDIVFIDEDTSVPGTVLLLDRSGSMGVLTAGIPASQYVQEAGLYLYHSAEDDDFVGTVLYNGSVETLFDYEQYDPANTLPFASFRNASGLTNIALALETAIDTLIAEHGEGGVGGGRIVLMSDGKQTTGNSLWTQVDRAEELGIRIHTMSFGNADAATMDNIATNTSGSSVEVSERDDAVELKHGLTRTLTELRGYVPILTYKGRLNPRNILKEQTGEVYQGQFVVPPKSRKLKFYMFAQGVNAAKLDLELIDPDGNKTVHAGDSIAERGRFNGATLPVKKPGVWTYRILNGKKRDGQLPRAAVFEILAHVEHRQLETQLTVTDVPSGNPWTKRIQADLLYRYPIAGARARAYVYVGSNLAGSIPLYDDGKLGGDAYADDGTYTHVFDMRKLKIDSLLTSLRQDQKRLPKLRIDVRFGVGGSAKPAPGAHYESETDFEELVKDFDESVRSDKAFSVWDSAYAQFHHLSDADKPSLRLIVKKGQEVMRRGKTTTITFEIRGARPTEDDLRYSLGAGVDVELASLKRIRRGLGVRGQLKMTPGFDIKPAKRRLRMQFGHTKLTARDRFYIK